MAEKQTTQKASTEPSAAQLASEALDEVQQVVNVTGQQIEHVVAPVRKSVIKRFPVLFLLAVTFGFTATVTGFEQLLIQTDLLQESPLVILSIGIAVLIITGTLYKKLG